MADLWLYISVVLMAGLKFLPAVAMSMLMGFGLAERILTTGIGGTLGVVVFAYLGVWIRAQIARRWPPRPPRPGRGDLRRRLWLRLGLPGVSFLVPFLMPAVATAIALANGTPRNKILLFMIPSIWLWAVIFGFAGHTFMEWWQALFG